MSKAKGSLNGPPESKKKRWGFTWKMHRSTITIPNKHYRTLLWAVVAAVVIYLVARNISAFGNILLVVLGFGAVVLVHEFGHFIVAKLCGVKVEAFSIGFPPTLAGIQRCKDGYRIRILPTFFPKENGSGDGRLSFTIGKKAGAGETEYRIGVIPVGGYNKMLGQEDAGPVKASDDPRSYANKPVGTRVAIIATGVVFNAISAILIFMMVFLVGIELPPPVVGAVLPDSPAARKGLEPGDEIIEIAGKSENLDFSHIQLAAALSDRGAEVQLKVKREDGSIKDFAIVAERLADMPLRLFGIIPPQGLTIAKVSDVNRLRKRTGLLPGDRVKSVNGTDVQTHWQLEKIVQNSLVPAVIVSAERTVGAGKVELVESQQIPLSLGPAQRQVNSESDLSHVYSMVPRLRIEVVDTKSGLQEGDIILAIGDVENPTFKELRDVTAEYEKRKLPMKVLRMDANVAKTLVVMVEPKRPRGGKRALIGIIPVLDAEHPVVAKTIATEGGPSALEIPRGSLITAVDGTPVSDFYDIISEIRRYPGQRITIDYRLNEEVAGYVALDVSETESFITFKPTLGEFVPFDDLKRLYKAGGPVDAVGMGYKKTVMFITHTYLTLRRLVGRDVSPKSLIGPVGILAASYTIVAERPFVYYVYFLGLLSACIAVVNFLPLPPLDGGLVVLLLAEKVKGSALSERTQGVIAYAGWVLIAAFFLYITFNDIARTFFG